jgi:hypothetical protein
MQTSKPAFPVGRIGGWMQTYTGGAWFFADPKPGDVNIIDIAHALSQLCRFGGHSRNFYSVAEHSVYVSLLVPPEFALQGLLHDATEAYVVDVPRPLKHMLSNYADFEGKAWQAIAERFGLPVDMDPSVKVADNEILLAERDQLLLEPPLPWTWANDIVPANVRIDCLSPRVAKDFFLRRFSELHAGRIG